jgi:hypothetical protein
MFHTHVASVYSRCCICFTHMLQVFYLDVAYIYMLQQHVSNVSSVADVCCIQVFHVASVHAGTVSDGRTARVSGDGAQ